MPDVPALRRSVAILRYLAGSNQPISAGTLARVLELPRSSAYELLAVLDELGLIIKVPSGYLLGAGVSELGSAYMRANPLQRLAQPIVLDLAESAGATAQLAILRGWETVYLVKEQAASSAAVITATGVHMPAYLTATGRAIMSRMEPRDVTALLSNEDAFVSRTGAGPRTRRELADMLRLARADGYTVERGEISPEIWTVAAPVLDASGRPVAALGLSMRREPDDLADPVVEADAAARVVRAAGELQGRFRR